MKKIISILFVMCCINSFAQTKSTDLVPFKKGNMFGYSDVNKKMILPVQYEKAELFSEGLAPAMKNNLWGFIDSTGKYIIDSKYEDVGTFIEGTAVAGTKNHKGLIDKKGKIIIPMNFDEIKHCDKRGFWIASDSSGAEYLLNSKGKTLYKADRIKEEGTLCLVERTKKVVNGTDTSEIDLTGMIYMENGKEIIPPNYKDVDMIFKTFGLDTGRINKLQAASKNETEFFDKNKELIYFVTKFDGKKGLYSWKSGEVFPCIYRDYDEDDLMEFGLTVAEYDTLEYVIDINGKKKSTISTTNIKGSPGAEWLSYTVGKKAGVMDEKGNVLTPPIFSEVKIRGKIGVGTLYSGDVLISGKMSARDTTADKIYEDIAYLYDLKRTGVAKVKKNGKCGLINAKGKLLLPVIYEYLSIRETDILLTINSKEGVADMKGNIKLKCEHEKVFCAADENFSAFIIQKDMSVGILKDGKFSEFMKISDTISVDFFDAFNGKDGKYIWLIKNDNLGILKYSNNELKTILPFNYKQVGEFIGDNITLSDTGGNGVTNKFGKAIVPFRYLWIIDASENAGSYAKGAADFFICASKNNTIEAWSPEGKLLLQQNAKMADVTEEDQFDPMRYGIQFDNSYKMMYDKTTKQFFPWKAYEISETPSEDQGGLMISDSSGKYAMTNKKGELLTQFIFKSFDNSVYDFKNQRAVLVFTDENNLKGLVDGSGKIICKAQYQSLEPMDSYKTFSASKSFFPPDADVVFKFGVVNNEGKEVMPCLFNSVEALYDDVFSAISDKGYTVIYDDEGNVLLPDEKIKSIDWLMSRGKIGNKNFINVSIVTDDDNINCYVDDQGNMFYEK